MSSNLAYVIENDILRVMSAADYEAMFGKKFNDRNVVEIVQLKYARPSYVLAALDNIKSALGRIIIDEDTGTVVMIDNEKERQKIVRCASAHISVSSKMSRCTTVFIQPSSENSHLTLP